MDKKEQFLLAQIDDAAEKCWEARYFDFFDERLQMVVGHLLKKQDVQFSFWGGRQEAERKMLCLYPDYLQAEDLNWPLAAIRFEKGFELNHRNVLGALMSLGIVRECLGDIDVTADFVQIIVVERMAQYIRDNFTRIAGCSIKPEIIPAAEIVTIPKQVKVLDLVASSERLDGIIGKIWGFSRQDAVDYIKGRRVRINYEEVTKGDYRLSAGDIIALRGKGKARVAQLGGTTKKGNLRLKVEKYIS